MKTSLLLGLLAIGLNATANAGGISLGTPLVSATRPLSDQELAELENLISAT